MKVVPALALVLALGCAAATGYHAYARLAPVGVDASIGPGQSAELAGVRYRLDSFTVATSLPPQDPDDPPQSGPAGSSLVLVVVTQTVLDRSLALDTHFCDVTLLGGSGRTTTVWETDSDVTGQVARPDALGCGATSSDPLAYDVARPMGFSFVVPTAQAARSGADGLRAELAVTDGGPVLELRP